MLTLKRVFMFVFILTTLALLVALVPINVSSAPAQAPELQDTVVPAITVVVTSVVPVTSVVLVPVTGGSTMSPLLVMGLLVLIGIAIVVVVLALTNNSRSNNLPPS